MTFYFFGCTRSWDYLHCKMIIAFYNERNYKILLFFEGSSLNIKSGQVDILPVYFLYGLIMPLYSIQWKSATIIAKSLAYRMCTQFSNLCGIFFDVYGIYLFLRLWLSLKKVEKSLLVLTLFRYLQVSFLIWTVHFSYNFII